MLNSPASGSSVAKDWLRALELTAQIDAYPDRTLPRVIAALAEQAPDAPAVLSAGESLTYRQLAEGANRYARWALESNLRKGDIVGLMMPNRPEYLSIWLGLSSVGILVALLNTHLRGAFTRALHRPRRGRDTSSLLQNSLVSFAPQYRKCNLAQKSGRVVVAISWPSNNTLDQLSGAPLTEAERPRRDARRSRSSYIHFWYDRAAQGSQR